MKEAIFIVLAASLIWLAACTPQTDLTYTQDIAPIIYQNCTPCHRSGGAAPFLLTEYQHVFRKKKTILAVTQSGLMPPWPADRMYSHFLGERYLSDSDKDKLKRWIEGGAPEGDVSLLPDLPSFNEFSLIGKPDTTLWFDSILIKGDSKDKFYIATLPIELPENKFVRAMEFLPNQNNLVHHMNGRLLNYDEGKKANIKSGERLLNLEADEDEYIQQFNALNLANDDGSRPPQINSATTYLPGVQAQLYPEGIGGFAMHKKSICLALKLNF